MSHGPLMFAFDHVSTTTPLELRTMRQPAGLAVGSAPLAPVGKLPTTTQPPGRIDRAVVRPTPPGHGSAAGNAEMVAKVVSTPLGDTSTSVAPVPCTLALALNLLMSVAP